MNAFEKLQLSLEKLWWGNHHPSEYVGKNADGAPCGVGVAYTKQQQDAVFNLWLWQFNFKTPAQMKKVSMNKQINYWGYAKKYAEMYHNGVEIGVEALGTTPEQFQDYIEEFNGFARSVSGNGGLNTKKSALE